MIKCEEGDLQEVTKLLEKKKYPLYKVNQNGYTALALAVKNG